MKTTYTIYILILTFVEIVAVISLFFLCRSDNPAWSKVGLFVIWLALAGIQAQVAKNGIDK